VVYVAGDEDTVEKQITLMRYSVRNGGLQCYDVIMPYLSLTADLFNKTFYSTMVFSGAQPVIVR